MKYVFLCFAAVNKHHKHRHVTGGYRPNGKDRGASRERSGEDSFHFQQPVPIQHDTKGSIGTGFNVLFLLFDVM